MAASGVIPTYPALLAYEVAFNAGPNQAAVPPYYTDLSPRTKQGAQGVQRGRQYELDINQAGVWRASLENKDGALDPSNSASQYAPGVVPYRNARIRAQVGANFLSIDQATAGEGTPYPAGQVPATMNVSNDLGYPLTLDPGGGSWTPFQGNQLYKVIVPSGATQLSTILLVTQVPVVPGTTYTFSAQALIVTGTTTPTSATVQWYDRNGALLSAPTGASVTITSGGTTWNTVSVSAAAPSTALSATLKLQIATGGSTAAQTILYIDGLQWEQSATVTAWQQPQTVSPNLFPRAIATGTGSINTATDSAANWFYPSAGSAAQASALSPAAPTGSATALAWTSSAGTTSTSPLYAGVTTVGGPATGPVADCVQVGTLTACTFSVYLMRAASADATVAVTAAIQWFNASGTLLSTTTGSNVAVQTTSWTRATVSPTTIPAGAAWGRPQIYISTPASTTATNVIYATGWQVEAAGAAGTWYDPGPRYQIFGGFIERWPQSWLFNGTYGVNTPAAVDPLAALAQYTLQAPFIHDVLGLKPNFLYALNDPASAASCVDLSANRPPAPIENSPAGAGSLTLGSGITANTPGSAFIGTSGPVATFANNPSQANAQEAQTFVSLHKATVAPGPPASGFWTRMIAFRCSTIPAVGTFPTLWNAATPSYSSDSSFFQLNVNPTTGTLSFQESGSNGLGPLYTSSGSICDGNWHLFAFAFAAGGYFDAYLDGVRVLHDNNAGAGWTAPTSIATDTIGAAVTYGRSAYVLGWVGDAALAVEFPFAFTTTQAAALYNSWRSADQGESSGARAQRVLNWIGWAGPAAIDTGQTVSMGPANDLTGATALDAINAIALTENGNFFASNTGALTFTSRTRRYGQQVPMYTFGENASLGEWPYQDVSADYDPAHLFNWIQVTHFSSGQVATVQDAISEQNNFPRILQRTINPSAFTEAVDAANYLDQQYKSARLRISNLTLNPSAVPGLFQACLALEIGTRIRVMRRPPGAPAIQFDGFVEQVQWTIDPASGAATVQLQCSPADLSSYWQLAALHTTLASQAASGQNQAPIRALPDSAYNTLAQSLPSGYQLTVDPGTSIAETMTIAAAGIPSTNPGYNSATLTFTSNFANTHAAGAVVCEPLPAGVTDPTTFDSASVLGAASCAVVSGGAAGTNTITVGTLGDARNNALNSDWTLGDLLWISLGTSAFEGYNLLTPNQSTAGEGAIPLATGADGNTIGITSAYSGTVPVTASASAWQGANVWQVSVGASAASSNRLIRVTKAAAAGMPFSWSVYVRSATTGANPAVHPEIQWLDVNSATISTVTGGTVTLTGGPSAGWTRLTLSGTAPAGAVWATPGVRLDPTTPASAWGFQGDGLQWEQNASPSVYNTTPQVLSVAASVPGYSSVTLTLNTNLINNHSVGDTVCDPLPPGVTVPSGVAATCRLAY